MPLKIDTTDRRHETVTSIEIRIGDEKCAMTSGEGYQCFTQGRGHCTISTCSPESLPRGWEDDMPSMSWRWQCRRLPEPVAALAVRWIGCHDPVPRADLLHSPCFKGHTMIASFIPAAKAACQASTPNRDIEILVTEMGSEP